MPGAIQRRRDAIKSALDRRYALGSELQVAQAELLVMAERLANVESLVKNQSEMIEGLLHQRESIVSDLDVVRASVAEVDSAVKQLIGTTRPAIDFVAQESPHDLRKRLFEAHRLAREGALAIEQLLQQEVLIKRDIDTAINASTEVVED